MRLVLAAPLLAVMWMGVPAVAAASQEPEAPAPEPVVATPEVAVPRTREAPVRLAEKPVEAAPRAIANTADAPVFSEDQSGGSRRRPPAGGSGGSRGQGARGQDGDRQNQGAVRRGGDRTPPPQAGADASSGADRGGSGDYAVRRQGAPYTGRYYDRTYRNSRPAYVYYDPWRYYDPWGYGAFGLGYFYYSPYWGYSGMGYGGYPGYGYPAYGYNQRYDLTGGVRLKVSPRDAEVWVDGYYAGSVDDFDGMFQSLRLEEGAYRIEVRKPGYEPLVFDVRVQFDRTITFRGELNRVP